MEYLVTMGILALAYQLQNNKDSNKNNKKISSKIPKNQLPVGKNIYTSKRSYNIFQEEQAKANILAKKSLYPEDTNIITPGPPYPIIYNKIDFSENTLPVEFNSYQKYDDIVVDKNAPTTKNDNTNFIKNNETTPNSGGFNGISLSGDPINPDNFTHNNQVPFFGGNVKQNLDEFSTRGIFENFTGTQDNYQKKQEQTLLFQPQKNMGNVYGTGNLDGYMLDRYYVSNIRSNETPIEKVYVGPGLNQGYTNEPSGGFQQPDAQDYSMPKTTDETRVKTKPKISYYGRVLSGQKIAKPGKVGTLYKNRPDTFFVQEPDRYFTTTGQVIAPEQRPCIITKYTNRKTTELKTRTGSAAPTNGTVAQIRSKYKVSHKVTYTNDGPRNADGAGTWSIIKNMLGMGTGTDASNDKNSSNLIPNDYGKKSIKIRNNKRVLNNKNENGTTIVNFKSPIEKGEARNNQKPRFTKKTELIKNKRINGNFQGSKKTKIYDPSDVPRMTIKETNIHNNHSGIISTGMPSKSIAYDPNDLPRTTIKETSIHNEYNSNVQNTNRGNTVYDPNNLPRTTIKETSIHNEYNSNIQNMNRGNTVYDPNNLPKTTIKETSIHNEYSSNIQNMNRGNTVYDPNNLPRTTIKETNIHNEYNSNVQNMNRGNTVYDPNNLPRTTVKETSIHNEYNSNVQNMNRGNTVYDPNNLPRTTIKETNIHNNHSGIIGQTAPSRGVVYDPNNITKTTIKETTIKNNRKANINNTGKGTYIKNKDKAKKTMKQTTISNNMVGIVGASAKSRNDGYKIKDIQVPNTMRQESVEYAGIMDGPELGAYDVTEVEAQNTNRQFTSDIEYFGGAGNDGVNTAPMSYEDIYNAEIKAIRATIDKGYTPNPGGVNEILDSNKINMTTTKMGDIQNKYINERGTQVTKVYNSIPQMNNTNLTQVKEIVKNEPLADRINPVILDAFKENPYTQSLTSWS
jgi:hypothetical protein